MKKKKTSPFKVRLTDHYQYEVTIPERGAIKTSATLDSALTLTLNDILKHFTSRSPILVFAYHDVHKKGKMSTPKHASQLLWSTKPLMSELNWFLLHRRRRESATWCLRSHAHSPEHKPTGSKHERESSSTNTSSKMSSKSSSMPCCRKFMAIERKQLMREHPPTLLIVYLCPANNEDALSCIDETLTVAGIEYRLIAQQEERVTLESAAPFIFTHNETRMVFALHAPLDPRAIEDLARLVSTGLVLGFVVKGEIALVDDVIVINNVGG